MKNKTVRFSRIVSARLGWLPNSITLLRLALVVPFLIFIHDIIVYNCTSLLTLILFLSIIISDVFDGYLARKLQCASDIGAKLDIFSDTLYVISSLVLLVYFKMIPIWFPIVTAIKLAEFIITSKLLKAKYPTNGFDKTGKTAIGIVMLMPGLFIFRHIITNYITVMGLTVYLVTALFALSSFGRISCLARSIKIEPSK